MKKLVHLSEVVRVLANLVGATSFIAVVLGLSGYIAYKHYTHKVPEQWYVEHNLPAFGAGNGNLDDSERTAEPFLHLVSSDGKPLCTAFVVDNNYALTAAHCVDDLAGQKINFTDINKENPSTGRVVAFYVRGDIGLIKGDFLKYKRLPVLGTQAVATQLVGHTLATCGFPLGQKELVCVPTLVVAATDSRIMGRGEMYPGMSGGPLIIPGIFPVVVGINFATIDFGNGLPADSLLFNTTLGFASAFGIEPKSP